MININDKITIRKYARGDNNRVVTIGELMLYFSYRTVVAFGNRDGYKTISENIFSASTGAHINAIEPDKTKRITRELFELQLEDVLEHYNIIGGE